MPNHRKLHLDAEQLRGLYIDQHLSQMEIARRFGVCNITVANWLRRYGIRRQVRYNYVDLPADELRRMYLEEKRTMEEICKHFRCGESTVRAHLIRAGLGIDSVEVAKRRLEANAKKYARRYEMRGYAHIKLQGHPAANRDGYVPEHRYLAECAMKRFLIEGEQVHHINLEKLDNRVENLAVLPTKADHLRLHKYMEKVAVYLCGLAARRPEPVDFGARVFWGGRYIRKIDLVEQARKNSSSGFAQTRRLQS